MTDTPANQPDRLTDDDVLAIVEGALPAEREPVVRAALQATPALVERIASLKADRAALAEQPAEVAPPTDLVAGVIAQAAAAGTWPPSEQEANAVIAEASSGDIPVAKISGSTVERPGRPGLMRKVLAGVAVAATVGLASTLIVLGAQNSNNRPDQPFAKPGEDFEVRTVDPSTMISQAETEGAIAQTLDSVLFGDDEAANVDSALSPDRTWRRSKIAGLEGPISTKDVLALAKGDRVALVVPEAVFASVSAAPDLSGLASWTPSASGMPTARFDLAGIEADEARVALILDQLNARCVAAGAELVVRVIPAVAQAEVEPNPVSDRDLFWWTRPATEWTATHATISIEPAAASPESSSDGDAGL